MDQTSLGVTLILILALITIFFVVWLIWLPHGIGKKREVDCMGTINLFIVLGLFLPFFWLIALCMACFSTNGGERRRREMHDATMLLMATKLSA